MHVCYFLLGLPVLEKAFCLSPFKHLPLLSGNKVRMLRMRMMMNVTLMVDKGDHGGSCHVVATLEQLHC